MSNKENSKEKGGTNMDEDTTGLAREFMKELHVLTGLASEVILRLSAESRDKGQSLTGSVLAIGLGLVTNTDRIPDFSIDPDPELESYMATHPDWASKLVITLLRGFLTPEGRSLLESPEFKQAASEYHAVMSTKYKKVRETITPETIKSIIDQASGKGLVTRTTRKGAELVDTDLMPVPQDMVGWVL